MREGSAFQARRDQKVRQGLKARRGLKVQKDALVGRATPARKVIEGQQVMSLRRKMRQTTPIWVGPKGPLQLVRLPLL